MIRLGLVPSEYKSPIGDAFDLTVNDGKTVKIVSIIGSGGTSITYKGVRTDPDHVGDVCIVKEYFPITKAEAGIYTRDRTGDPIRIMRDIDKERQKQKKNIDRELRIHREVFHNNSLSSGKIVNNNPYIYKAEEYGKYGDTSYILLHTSDGRSLDSVIKDAKEGILEITLDYAIRLTRQLSEAIGYMNERGFIHCDIKPQNIWLRGKNDNESICLLDFGSTIRMEECSFDPEGFEPDMLLKKVDDLIEFEGLGSSTLEYRSGCMSRLASCRRTYENEKTHNNRELMLEAAKEYINALSSISVADDLHAAVVILDELIHNVQFSWDDDAPVNSFLYTMKDSRYSRVDELIEDLDILETIAKKGAHPLVLKRAMTEVVKSFSVNNINPDLLCDVEIK